MMCETGERPGLLEAPAFLFFFWPLFTEVRRRGILRTSRVMLTRCTEGAA
jgi:hypothetical protein